MGRRARLGLWVAAAMTFAALVGYIIPTEILAGHIPPRPPYRSGKKPKSRYEYGEVARNPVPPCPKSAQVYEEGVKADTDFEKPHPTAEAKRQIRDLLLHFVGVRSPERRLEAEDAVRKLVLMGDDAVLKVCEAVEGPDPDVSLWCLSVMDQAWHPRYAAIVLDILEHRAMVPEDLGEAAFGVLARHACPEIASPCLRLLLAEDHPVFLKQLCVITWRCHPPEHWKRVLKIAQIEPPQEKNGKKEDPSLALMELRQAQLPARLARFFTPEQAGAGDPAGALLIGAAQRLPPEEVAARRGAAMMLAWSAKDAQKDALKTMAEARDDVVALYGLAGQARLRTPEVLGKLIDYLGRGEWWLRYDAQRAITLLTGKSMDYDFAADRKERLRGIAAWRAYEELKTKARDQEAPEGKGWQEVKLQYVLDPKVADFESDRAFADAVTSDRLLTPGILEDRWGFVHFRSGVGDVPLMLAKGRVMRMRCEEKRNLLEYAVTDPGDPVPVYQPLLVQGQSSKPVLLEVQPAGQPAANLAFCFGRYSKTDRGMPYFRAGYVEGNLNGLRIRVFDDDSNGEFNDYGVDAVAIGDQRYATLLSAIVRVGERFCEFRVDRGGTRCWLRPYEGPLGAVAVQFPAEMKIRPLSVQLQCDAVNLDVATNGAPQKVPAGKYALAHALLADNTRNRVIVTQGNSGTFGVEADAVYTLRLGEKLEVHVDPSSLLKCDDCGRQARYTPAPGGRVLKIDVPYVVDGPGHDYIRFSAQVPVIRVEIHNPNLEKIVSDNWHWGSDLLYAPYYRVLTPQQVVPGRYRARLFLKLEPFGNLWGEKEFTVLEDVVAAKP